MDIKPAQLSIIELTEYEPKLFNEDEITYNAGVKLYENYKIQIDVEFPNYRTNNQWKLLAKGWVGYIPLTPNLHIRINSKVPIKNIFEMWEYVYELKSFRILEGLMDCDSLEGFYNKLAYRLAEKILERCHKGLYRAYLPKTDKFANVRGKLDIRYTIEKPWIVKLKCHYEEHTADITENQLLIYTLYIISHSNLCSEKVSTTVRKVYHALQSLVSLQPYKPEDCIGRMYNRLNKDYQILHHICYFFLENTAPSHKQGKNATLPFLVNMHNLYELFVAEWLKVNLPHHLTLKSQEIIKKRKNLYFKIDLVLYEKSTLIPRYTLDTKYKTPNKPSPQDIAQVVTYAVSKNCQQTVLIYPNQATNSLDETFGNIRVRSLTFPLDQNLNTTGKTFLKHLLTS